MGGTKIESEWDAIYMTEDFEITTDLYTALLEPGLKDFFKHFREEIRNQLQNKIK